MEENSSSDAAPESNGPAENGESPHFAVGNGAANGNGAVPLVPRVLPPEGARSARAFDGSPLEEAPAIVEAAPDELNGMVPVGADYRADLQDSFPDALPPQNGVAAFEWNDDAASYQSEPPLGIAIEKVAPADDDVYDLDQISGAGSDAISGDVLTGEQLFADDGTAAESSSNLAISGGDNGGDEPPSNLALSSGAAGRPDTPRDKEAGLFDHLIELRQRLLYAIFGVVAMMCLTWRYSLELQDWFSAPILRVLNNNGIKKGILMVTGPTDTFTIYFQFSLVSALILAMPWVLFQVWRFIEPALTNSERRYTLVLVPFSSVLFFMGVALGYALSPLFFQFFLQFQPQNVAAQWNYQDSIMLMAKMLMIFGLSFQVPIIIIFGNKVGLLSRNLLIEYWRHAVVAIFIIVAVLTPTWDPFTMTACALPPCLLYLLSIWLVKWL